MGAEKISSSLMWSHAERNRPAGKEGEPAGPRTPPVCPPVHHLTGACAASSVPVRVSTGALHFRLVRAFTAGGVKKGCTKVCCPVSPRYDSECSVRAQSQATTDSHCWPYLPNSSSFGIKRPFRRGKQDFPPGPEFMAPPARSTMAAV